MTTAQRITFTTEQAYTLALDLGISRPWDLSAPELKAAILNTAANRAATLKVQS